MGGKPPSKFIKQLLIHEYLSTQHILVRDINIRKKISMGKLCCNYVQASFANNQYISTNAFDNNTKYSIGINVVNDTYCSNNKSKMHYLKIKSRSQFCTKKLNKIPRRIFLVNCDSNFFFKWSRNANEFKNVYSIKIQGSSFYANLMSFIFQINISLSSHKNKSQNNII